MFQAIKSFCVKVNGKDIRTIYKGYIFTGSSD